MFNLLDVASNTLGLACRGAVPLVGVAILLGISSRREAASPGGLHEPAPKAVLARDEDDTLHVTLAFPEGKAYARCVVRDQEGVELMSLHYSSNGSLCFNLAESPTIGATGYRCADGEFGFQVGGEGLVFEYARRPGSPPFVKVESAPSQQHARYQVTPEGSLILDPGAPAK